MNSERSFIFENHYLFISYYWFFIKNIPNQLKKNRCASDINPVCLLSILKHTSGHPLVNLQNSNISRFHTFCSINNPLVYTRYREPINKILKIFHWPIELFQVDWLHSHSLLCSRQQQYTWIYLFFIAVCLLSLPPSYALLRIIITNCLHNV